MLLSFALVFTAISAEEEEDWQRRQTIQFTPSLRFTWWTTLEDEVLHLNGIVDFASSSLFWGWDQTRICLEFAHDRTKFNKRDQMVFYGIIDGGYFDTLGVYEPPGTYLQDADKLCMTPKSSSKIIDRTADMLWRDNGESINYISNWYDVARVGFKRPFSFKDYYPVEFEANTMYKVHMSYYIAAAGTATESSVAAAKEPGSQRPAFMDIEVLGPAAGRDERPGEYDNSLTGNE